MAAENESSQFKPNNGVYLITFNDNQNLTFFGKCKLCINVLSKYLIIEPYDESIKMISVSFEQLMIKQKNILCVCSSVTNFVLVFKDKQICKKVFNGTQRKKTQSHELLNIEIMDIFNQQFFIPLIKATKENTDLKNTVKNFISLLKPSQINEITRIIKEREMDCFLCFTELLPEISIIESNPSNSVVHESSDKRNLRKRKFVDYQKMGDSNENSKKVDLTTKRKTYPKKTFGQNLKPPKPTSVSNVVIRKPAFKLEQCEKPGFCVKNLVVYFSSDSKLCYTYFYHKGSYRRYKSQHLQANPHYECRGCLKLKKRITAKLIIDKNGEECIELSKNPHICEPQEEEPILSSTEFEIQNRGKKLLIFASKEDRSLCYEYFSWVKNIYICRGCDKLDFFYCHVKIFNNLVENGENENYIKVCHEKHVCKPIKYEPKEKENIIKLPNFKIDKFGDKCKNLVIYDPNNKNLCYNFIFSSPRGNLFECYKCRNQKIYVTARLHNDEESEPFVELNLVDHICEPHPEETIVHNIHVQCNDRKVIIPFESDPTLCYEYVLQKGNTYRCRECCRIKFHSNIWLFGNSKDGYYAKIVDKKHACKPIKFEAKEKRTIIKKPYYKIEKFYKNGIENKSLVVYDLENSKLCFNYSYMNSKKHFRCSKCHNLNAFVTANIRQKNGEEFIELGLNEHVCKLLLEERILSSNEFYVPSKNAKKEDPNNLFIFDSENKNLWYEFLYSKGNIFRCRMCLMKSGSCQVKLFQNENGEYYVKIDEGKHFCKPTKVPSAILKNLK